MILVDTSVWVDHFRRTELALVRQLADGQVLMHPFVLGEIALGSLSQRAIVLGSMKSLPHAVSASDMEVLEQVEMHRLHGCGIGYVDAHLLASARLSSALIWTRDKRLRAVAEGLGVHSCNLP